MKLLSFAKYVALLSVFSTTACQTEMLSDSRIADNTAGVLGVAPASVVISNRHGDATNTYYIAHAAGRNYACVINGGGLLAMGMTNPPSCNRL